MVPKKPSPRIAFMLFAVRYEDGSHSSNRKVPSVDLGGLDDVPAHTVIAAQDQQIANRNGPDPVAPHQPLDAPAAHVSALCPKRRVHARAAIAALVARMDATDVAAVDGARLHGGSRAGRAKHNSRSATPRARGTWRGSATHRCAWSMKRNFIVASPRRCRWPF